MGDAAVTTAMTLPDPFKRVNYAKGMVLGVDEFQQEQAYFLERGQLRNRALHGYGTVYGLQVTVEGAHIVVSPGVAVTPSGREVRVTEAYEADLNEWLGWPEHLAGARENIGEGEHMIAIILRPREREAEFVPIASMPSDRVASADDGESGQEHKARKAASRIVEGFHLDFSVKEPEYAEDDAVRRFGRLLGRLQTGGTHPPMTAAAMAGLVRELAEPEPLYSVREDPLHVGPDQLEDVLQAAFRTWVTVVRPVLLEKALARVDQDAGVLVSRIGFGIANGRAVDVQVIHDERPLLLNNRLLQEYLLRGRELMAGSGGNFSPQVFGRLQGRSVSPLAPHEGEVLTWSGTADQWEPRPAHAGGIHLTTPMAVLPLVTITRLSGGTVPTFEFWFHLSHRWSNTATPPHLHGAFQFAVYAESDHTAELEQLEVVRLQALGRNKFIVALEQHAAHHRHLQFHFFLDTMMLQDGESLARWMARQTEHRVGHDGQNVVTVFFSDAGAADGAWQQAAPGTLQPAPAQQTEPVEPAPAVLEPVPSEPPTRPAKVPMGRRRTVEPVKRSWLSRAWRWIMGLD